MPFARSLFVAVLTSAISLSPHAAELQILVAGAAKAAFEGVAQEYERSTGDTLKVRYDTVGALRDRVLAGESIDLVILSNAAIDALEQKGVVSSAQRRPLGTVVAGLAVRAGAPTPDISTAAALKQTLLAAPSIAQADGTRGATSGAHFTQLIDALGLRESLKDRISVLPFGAEAIQGVVDGKFALGVSQSSEIVPVAGVVFVGEFPPPYGLRTAYTAAVIRSSAGGNQLLAYLQTDAVRSQFARSGLSQP